MPLYPPTTVLPHLLVKGPLTLESYLDFGSRVADHIYLYDRGGSAAYGFGIQPNRLVAFTPLGGPGFAIRPTQSSGAQSAGVDAIVLQPEGALTQIINNTLAVGHIIQGAVTQSANLSQWLSSAGAVLARMSSAGHLGIGTVRDTGLTGPFVNFAPTQVTLTSTSVSSNPLLVVSTMSGQTASIQEWQHDGTLRMSVSSAGVLFIGNASTVPSANPSNGGVLYAQAGDLKWRSSSGRVTDVAPASFVTASKFSID